MGKPVIPVKDYDKGRHAVPHLRSDATMEEQLAHYKARAEMLRHEVAVLTSRIERFEAVITDEVEFWENGFAKGWTEGITALKRRLSMLRGALQFQGVASWAKQR